jgi:hypothetical protein
LDELLLALQGECSRAVRHAIRREVFALFDTVAARPAAAERQQSPASDANGSEPVEVERALFVQPAETEIRIMEAVNAAALPNGFDAEVQR